MNKQTGNEYYVRLSNFERFILSKYGSSMNIDSFVKGFKVGKSDAQHHCSSAEKLCLKPPPDNKTK